MATNWVTATVIENRQLTAGHFSLVFDAELLAFKAGQFARLQVEVENNDGELEHFAKPYSLVNTPDEQYAEVYFNTVPEGKVSNGLASLKAGDTLEIAQPCVGFFVLDQIPQTKHAWMFATGTGIGPYLSMLKTDQAWTMFEKVILVHAVRQADQLCYAELIQQFTASHPEQFQFISIVSREDHAESLRGRIPQLIENKAIEQKVGLEINVEDSHVLLCGNSGMLKDTKEVLKERRMERHLNHKPGHISSEQYF